MNVKRMRDIFEGHIKSEAEVYVKEFEENREKAKCLLDGRIDELESVFDKFIDKFDDWIKEAWDKIEEQEKRKENPPTDGSKIFTINGERFTYVGDLGDVNSLTYKQIIKWAGLDMLRCVCTVTYTRGKDNAQGSVSPGESVSVVSGMIINATVTDSA